MSVCLTFFESNDARDLGLLTLFYSFFKFIASLEAEISFFLDSIDSLAVMNR